MSRQSEVARTDANQAEYPQQKGQKPGLGFPIVRMVVLFSLATGMLCDMAMGPYRGKETGEPALFREMFERLNSGDIVLADRCFCSYFMIAMLMELGVDFVVRLHQARTADFRRGRIHSRRDRRTLPASLAGRTRYPRDQDHPGHGCAAMQAIAASWIIAALLDSGTFASLVDTHLTNLAGHHVGHRPDRVEPRAVKRRPKPHRLLSKPRAEARAELLLHAAT